MNSLLLIHIVSFSISLIFTGSLLVRSALGQHVSSALMKVNAFPMVGGTASGLLLLVTNPLGSYCAMLVAYLLAFALATSFIRRRNATLIQSTEL